MFLDFGNTSDLLMNTDFSCLHFDVTRSVIPSPELLSLILLSLEFSLYFTTFCLSILTFFFVNVMLARMVMVFISVFSYSAG